MRSCRGRLSPLTRIVAFVSVVVGLCALLYVGYLLWGTSAYTAHSQRQLTRQLDDASDRSGSGYDRHSAGPTLRDGKPLATIRIPALGTRYRYVIVEGTRRADLAKGPGHYAGSALPGNIGNFVVSGHNATHMAPFSRINELGDGDRILITTDRHEYVYRVTYSRVVLPTEIAVTAPSPGHPHAKPRKSYITLTTCYPKYSASHRLIVSGELRSTRVRTTNQPG